MKYVSTQVSSCLDYFIAAMWKFVRIRINSLFFSGVWAELGSVNQEWREQEKKKVVPAPAKSRPSVLVLHQKPVRAVKQPDP